MNVGCVENGLRRNEMLRENMRKWKHEIRKQANMHNGTASKFRGTIQICDDGDVTAFSKSRQIVLFILHFIFLRFCVPNIQKAK